MTVEISMHDNLWNSFVTLLSALSPAHLRWCWTAQSPQSITGDLPQQITHPQPARILFMQRFFLSERLHSLQIRLSCCSGAPSKALCKPKTELELPAEGSLEKSRSGPWVTDTHRPQNTSLRGRMHSSSLIWRFLWGMKWKWSIISGTN